MIRYLLSTLLLIFISACSNSNDTELNIPTVSGLEKLIEHSKEFEQQVISYETPGGKIHFAIGFGIANSIMVEGEGGNIIIDAADSVYEAERIYKLFSEKNSNQQQRFITFLDIVYDQNIPMAISAEQNIDKLTSSRLLEKPFKRTISRLYELTSKKHL